jgi:hypothetical protein
VSRTIFIVTMATALIACGDDGGVADVADAGSSDTRVLGDREQEPDVDALEPDVASDVVDAEDAAQDADESDAPHVVQDITVVDEPEDSGTACDTPELCEGEFDCVEGVCTLDPAGRTYVEQSYRIREPAEVTHVFDFIKTFAADVAFFMLDVSEQGDPGRRPARYGTADRLIVPDTLDIVYAWQFPEIDRLMLTPVRGPGGLRGDVWESNQFQWNLRAHVVLEDLNVDEIIGFVAEYASVRIEFADDMEDGRGEFRGVVTRREAEDRYFGSSAFEPFRAIICTEHPNLVPPGERWSLADIMDCNATPLDVDINGDGVLDGYNMIVDFLVEPAVLAPPEMLAD